MTILNRINKLEKQSGSKRDLSACNCKPGALADVYLQLHGAEHATDANGKVYRGPDSPCEECGKPIDRQIVIVHGVEGRERREWPTELGG